MRKLVQSGCERREGGGVLEEGLSMCTFSFVIIIGVTFNKPEF